MVTPQTGRGGFGGPFCTEPFDAEVQSRVRGACGTLAMTRGLASDNFTDRCHFRLECQLLRTGAACMVACDCSASWDSLNEIYCGCDAISERECQLVLGSEWYGM